MVLPVLVVPLRGFEQAKSRLGRIMSARDRTVLARSSATRVLERSVPCDRVVVSDDDDVATWANDLGIGVVAVRARGLNESLTEALPSIIGSHPGATLVIAHGDILEPDGLDALLSSVSTLSGRFVTLVPDRHDDGTNVLCLDSDTARSWEFAYGPGSFERHRRQAETLALEVTVRYDVGLAIDLDTPEDLEDRRVRTAVSRLLPDWPNT